MLHWCDRMLPTSRIDQIMNQFTVISQAHLTYNFSLAIQTECKIKFLSDLNNEISLQWPQIGAISSLIAGNSIVCLLACSGKQQGKIRSSTLLFLCEGNPLMYTGFPPQRVEEVIVIFVWNVYTMSLNTVHFFKLISSHYVGFLMNNHIPFVFSTNIHILFLIFSNQTSQAAISQLRVMCQ